MRLAIRREPFDHPDFIYEVKYDGFRALAYIEGGYCRLVSRKAHVYKSFPSGSLLPDTKHDGQVLFYVGLEPAKAYYPIEPG
jgi:ATP-dependent DNA ligase